MRMKIVAMVRGAAQWVDRLMDVRLRTDIRPGSAPAEAEILRMFQRTDDSKVTEPPNAAGESGSAKN